jgi:NAD(P)-dependent dehydrogenase (short-subunit alcohol dehydrogenase family)
MKLKNKASNAVLITGGAQRIGKSIALALANRGFDIALHYNHSRVEVVQVAQEIRQKGVRCEVFVCDLQKESQVLLLLEKVYKKFRHLNLLVNNASIFQPSGLGKQGLKSLDSHWTINFRAPFILTGEFARLCRKGQVINILDTKITKNKTDYVGYLISKKALGELTKISAVALSPNIRVNGISPGIILPPPNKGR